MNIFVTDSCPIQSARNLPDKHIVKMPLETCQMLAIIYSDWYYGVGKLYKSDGTPYRTAHGAFRNHPCTQWAAANQYNLAWLIQHGLALCTEYNLRYDKVHTCERVIHQAESIYRRCFDDDFSQASRKVAHFTRAMPESIKFDTTIDTITAYKQYLNTKPWLATNYLRIPSRKPSFIITTMTTTPNKSDLPLYDFSGYKGDPILSDNPEIAQKAKDEAAQDAALAKALADAKDAMAEKRQEAPAVKAIKAKGLVPAKKAVKTSPAKGKAGRIVGISKDENEFIQEVLQMIADDPELGASNPNYVKIQARYNK